MIIKYETIKHRNPCQDGVDWLNSQDTDDLEELMILIIEQKQYEFGFWLVNKVLLTNKQQEQLIDYAVNMVIEGPLYTFDYAGIEIQGYITLALDNKVPFDYFHKTKIRQYVENMKDDNSAKLLAYGINLSLGKIK